MAATTTAATGRGGRRARARDAALPRLRFIDGEEEDARAARDGADADDRDAREEKKNEVGRGEEEGEETGASGEREATGGGAGETKVVMVIVPEYEADAADATESDRKRMRSIRRRLVQTPEHREKERLRSQRRRDALTPAQKRAAADAKIARRKHQRLAKEAVEAARLLAGQRKGHATH
jgi:hypothetical protein